MCNKRWWDALAVAVSLLIAIGLTILNVCWLLKTCLIPFLGLFFAALALFLTVLAATSLLRQNPHFDGCVVCRADRVIAAAIALLLVSALALLLPHFLRITLLILHFIIFALFVYAALSLACLLLCLVRERKPK